MNYRNPFTNKKVTFWDTFNRCPLINDDVGEFIDVCLDIFQVPSTIVSYHLMIVGDKTRIELINKRRISRLTFPFDGGVNKTEKKVIYVRGGAEKICQQITGQIIELE